MFSVFYSRTWASLRSSAPSLCSWVSTDSSLSQQWQVDPVRKWWIILSFVFITPSNRWRFASELEPGYLTTVWFHSNPPPPPPHSPPPAAPCLSLWSCLPRRSTSPVCLAAAPRAFLPHSSLLGRGAPMDGPQGRPVQNANQPLCGTSHDFPPRRELLFRYWFHYNQTGPVTFLLSGGWSAALTAAHLTLDPRSLFHSFTFLITLCTHLNI